MKVIPSAVLFLCCSLAFSASIFEGKAYAPARNDYVVYYDHRNGEQSIFGIQYLGGDTYRVRYYNLKTKEELIATGTIKETPQNFTLSDSTFEKGTESMDSAKKTMMPLMLLKSQNDKVDRTVFPNDAMTDFSMGEGAQKVNELWTYKFWVPIFGLYEIQEKGSGSDNAMVLLAFGKPGEKDDGKFLTTNDYPESRQGPHYQIPKKDVLKLKAGKVNLVLDKNWQIENGEDLILKIQTPRDAFISFENFTFDESKEKFQNLSVTFAYLRMTGMEWAVAPGSVLTQASGKATVLSCDVLNDADKMYTHVIEVVLNEGNGAVAVVYVNTYSSLYETNRDYFDTIVKMVIGP